MMKVKFNSKEKTFGDFSLDDLTFGKVYEVISKKEISTTVIMYRMIDDSGEEYSYPAYLFEVVA